MQALFSKNISVKDIDIYPKEAYNKCIGSERIREKPKRQKQKRRIIMDAVDFFKTVNRLCDYVKIKDAAQNALFIKITRAA